MEQLICDRCGKALVMREVKFTYLDFDFRETLPSCPECGQVYLSEEFVNTKVARLEEELEEK